MINFHKVLISTAIVFCFGFAIWSSWVFAGTNEPWAAASAVGFGLATLGFGVYLRNLKRFLGQ